MKFPFDIIFTRKKVKYLRIKIRSKCLLEVVLPIFFPKKRALFFIDRKREWILESLQKFEKSQKSVFVVQGKEFTLELSDELQPGAVKFHLGKVLIGADTEKHGEMYFRSFLKRSAEEFLPPELDDISKNIGIPYSRLKIRSQTSKWGSCSRKGNISLNAALMKLPAHLRQYVMIHELCHIKEMNHSRKFWAIVGGFCPEWKRQRKELKSYST
ncbi:M48 family metallopeptidase [Candidatus Peregrinibacteria bacterium]|nr:M48 family metallopeptidase [Candidatus Peregrinibacteria bacterium]